MVAQKFSSAAEALLVIGGGVNKMGDVERRSMTLPGKVGTAGGRSFFLPSLSLPIMTWPKDVARGLYRGSTAAATWTGETDGPGDPGKLYNEPEARSLVEEVGDIMSDEGDLGIFILTFV
jgi:hypothetical protein